MMLASLPLFEIGAYFVIFGGSVAYSIFQVYSTGTVFQYLHDNNYGDFKPGWFFKDRHVDVTDNEWSVGIKILGQMVPWCLVHIAVGEILRISYVKFLLLWHITISTVFLYTCLGFTSTLLLIAYPILSGFTLKTQSKIVIWIYHGIVLLLINFIKWQNVAHTVRILSLNEVQYHILMVILPWTNMRCISYYFDNINDEKQSIFLNTLRLLSYTLYLPTLIFGPPILYSDYKLTYNENQRNITVRLKDLIISILRFGFWLVFTEIALHYVYVNAIQVRPHIVMGMGAWALYGLGYSMGQFFHLKYVVFYGLSTSVAKFEGMVVPKTPKCIGRIHLYSDMWRYFDQGLHSFLIKCIYIPSTGKSRSLFAKVVGSFLCFTFVYVWHGTQTFILIWSVLNFIGIVIENICSSLAKTNVYHNLAKRLSPCAYRRLVCAFQSPLLAMSAISNFFFFAGSTVGYIFVKRILNDSFQVNIILLFILYCCCQLSTEVKKWELKDHTA